MRILRTNQFKKDFQKMDEKIKRSTEKALHLLMANPRHPSLRVKKTSGVVLEGAQHVYEARITQDYRMLFLIVEDMYILLRCGRHEEFF